MEEVMEKGVCDHANVECNCYHRKPHLLDPTCKWSHCYGQPCVKCVSVDIDSEETV